jgi:hypothetical protein
MKDKPASQVTYRIDIIDHAGLNTVLVKAGPVEGSEELIDRESTAYLLFSAAVNLLSALSESSKENEPVVN